MSLVLGIETTCDETAAAVVRDGRTVLSSVVGSQAALHEPYGGVVPEIAARAHIETLNGLVEKAMRQAGAAPADLTAIAAPNRPGLIGCLLVGVSAAKAFAFAWERPLICVNHVEAHLYSACLRSASACAEMAGPPLPALGLVISGGHTSLYRVHDFVHIECLGATIDDAAGEAFDKVAAILGLGYPGGPQVDRLAGDGNPHAVKFPISLLGRDSLDFSFSGLKTAVLYQVQGGAAPAARRGAASSNAGPAPRPPGRGARRTGPPIPPRSADIAASFQYAVVEALRIKLRRAAKRHPVRSVIIGGGVSANRRVRAMMEALGGELGLPVYLPAAEFCTDNAAMIAGLAAELHRHGVTHTLDTPVIATI